LRAGEIESVEELSRLLLQTPPGSDELAFKVASFLHASGRRGSALALYRRSIAAGHLQSIPQAATILAGIGQYDEALGYFDRSPQHRRSPHHLDLMFAARFFEEAVQLARERFEASDRTIADYRAAIDHLVRGGHPELAVELIEAAPPEIRADRTIDWCGRLYRFLLVRLAQSPGDSVPQAAGKRDLLVSVVAWGAEYAERVGNIVLASLAAPGNLPALANDRRVRLRIYTDLVGRMMLQRAPSVQALTQHIEIEYDIIPAALLDMKGIATRVTARYLLLGMLCHLSVIEAGRSGRDIMLLGADCVYSSRFGAHLAELVQAGREVISVSVSFSANDSMLEALEIWRHDEIISIDSEDLVDLGFAHMHHRTQTGCVDLQGTKRTDSPAMLFFRTKDGLAYRKLGVDLTYLTNAAIPEKANFDYLTPDGEMPDRIMPPGQWHRIHRVDDSSAAVLIELIPDQQIFPQIDGTLTPQNVVDYADTYGFLNYMRHCFRYETQLRGRRPPPWPGDQDYSDFIERTRQLLFDL
jgi:hypothetical protein